MSLFHAPLKSSKQHLASHKKQYRTIVAERNQLQDSLLQQLGVTLSIAAYKEQRALAWKTSQQKLRVYTQEKKRLIEEHTFLGRNSLKYWLFLFGIFTTLGYFALKSLVHDIKATLSTGHLYASIGGISIAIFWLIHVFFMTQADYEVETYFFTILGISVLIALFVFGLIKYFVKKESIIQSFIALILRLKQKHYRKILVKAIYAEKHNKALISAQSLQEEAAAFDADITNTIKTLEK